MEITAEDKKKLCLYKNKNPKATINDQISWFQKTFKKTIGRSTVGDIIKAEEKWINKDTSSKALQHRTRDRPPQHQQMEDALFIWLNTMNSKHIPISDMMLTEKAKEFGITLGITDFSYSSGWLKGFKEHRGVKAYTYHGESASADMAQVQQGHNNLQETLSNFALEDMYNMDETGLDDRPYLPRVA